MSESSTPRDPAADPAPGPGCRDEALFRAVFDAASDAMLLTDDGGRCVDANPAACALLGVARVDLLGRRPPDPLVVRRPDGTARELESQVTAEVVPGVSLTVLRDVSERHEVQVELARREARLRALFEQSTEVIALSDVAGAVLYVSPSVERVLGGAPETFVGQRALDCFLEDDGPAIRAARRAILDGPARRAVVEARRRHPDGSIRWIEATLTNCLADPAVGAVVANFRDVTAAHRASAALSESEQRYRVLVEHSPEPTLVHVDRKIFYANDAAARALGVASAADLVGRSIVEFAVPETRPGIEARMRGRRDPLLGGLAEQSFVRVDDGRTVTVEVASSPIVFDGHPAVLTVARDVTRRVAAEREAARLIGSLEFERRRLGALLQKAPAFMAVLRGPRHVIELVNDAYEALVGPRDLLGRPLAEAIPEAARDGMVVALDAVLATGEPFVGACLPMVVARGPGELPETRFVDVMYQCLVEADGARTGVFVHGVDVTGRRTLEGQLRQAQKMEAIGRLAAGIAHDFNNLLSVVLGYSDLALSELGADDPLREPLTEIRAASERAAGLTRQLLAFSRQQVLEPRVVDLGAIVRGMEQMVRRLVGEDVETSFVIAPDIDHCRVDPGQIEQVVLNLVVNARDAMPTGGTLTIEVGGVTLDADYAAMHVGARGGRHVVLTVTDTGAGIDAVTRERIFEPFFTTKELGKGTGLGLATVLGIVQQSEGHIWVYSEPGHGTSFKAYLPAVQTALTIEPAPPAPSRGVETVLLIEDDAQVRRVARGILARGGYTVLDADTPAEAAALCGSYAGPIDLLLSDVVMPKTSGPELARRLVLLRPAMRVLFMSGYTDNTVLRHGVLDATLAFLQKPFTAAALLRKVREVLEAPLVAG